MRTVHKIMLPVALISLLTGCASQGETVYNQQTPTMSQIYQMANNSNEQDSLTAIRGVVADGSSDNRANYAGFTQASSKQALNKTFPLLPDDEITMYVYPHLAGSDEVPVPGYTTAFFLYDKPHFALPGEVATTGNHYYAG